MGHFLYYAPGAKNIQREDFARLGLGHLDGLNPSSRQCIAGPDNGPGTIFVATRPKDTGEHRVGYYPAEQTWVDRGPVWVGWFNADPPAPQDLIRAEAVAAHAVKMSDGQDWHFPVAPALPVAYVFDRDNHMTEKRLAQYARLYAIAERIAEVQASEPRDMDMLECVQMLSEALGYNYHISFLEVGAYGLASSDNVALAADAILDYPQLRKIMEAMRDAGEKKECAGAVD